MYFLLRKHLFDLKEMNFFIVALITIYLSHIPYFEINIFDKLRIMCNEEYSDIMSRIEMLQERIEMFLSHKIYPDSWFIEDEYFRSREERFRYKDTLLLPSGKLTKELFFVFKHSYMFECGINRFIRTPYYFLTIFWYFRCQIHDFLDTHRDKGIKSSCLLRNVFDTIGIFFTLSSVFLKPSNFS